MMARFTLLSTRSVLYIKLAEPFSCCSRSLTNPIAIPEPYEDLNYGCRVEVRSTNTLREAIECFFGKRPALIGILQAKVGAFQ